MHASAPSSRSVLCASSLSSCGGRPPTARGRRSVRSHSGRRRTSRPVLLRRLPRCRALCGHRRPCLDSPIMYRSATLQVERQISPTRRRPLTLSMLSLRRHLRHPALPRRQHQQRANRPDQPTSVRRSSLPSGLSQRRLRSLSRTRTRFRTFPTGRLSWQRFAPDRLRLQRGRHLLQQAHPRRQHRLRTPSQSRQAPLPRTRLRPRISAPH
jgi:hypothetical protein